MENGAVHLGEFVTSRVAYEDTLFQHVVDRVSDVPSPLQPTTAARTPRRFSRDGGLRVAIVHEWLEKFAGSERVLAQLLACFPSADLFAVADFMSKDDREFLGGRTVRTTFIQKLPFARRLFRHYIGLMPLAIQQLDLSAYDLVISSNHAVAKGVLTGPDQLHVSYMHSPMRYIWDLQHQYLREAGIEGGLRGAYARWLFNRLRQWDVATAQQVDLLLANSTYIARRIKKAYRRDAIVVHPPVDVERFSPGAAKDDYFLLACRFVPYKRADIVVESFARHPERRLVVVGDGPEAKKVRQAARGAGNIEFHSSVTQDDMVQLMQHARALVFAGEEDFGITLVEAQACGTPVIAYGRGGSVDIVVTPEQPGSPTGLLFPQQDASSISDAIDQFEANEHLFSPEACRLNAMRFSEPKFRDKLTAVIEHLWIESASIGGLVTAEGFWPLEAALDRADDQTRTVPSQISPSSRSPQTT